MFVRPDSVNPVLQILFCLSFVWKTNKLPLRRHIFLYFWDIYLFLHKNICCAYSLEVPWWGTSNEYTQHTFLWGTVENYPRIIMKYSSIRTPLDIVTLNTLTVKTYNNKWIQCSSNISRSSGSRVRYRDINGARYKSRHVPCMNNGVHNTRSVCPCGSLLRCHG